MDVCEMQRKHMQLNVYYLHQRKQTEGVNLAGEYVTVFKKQILNRSENTPSCPSCMQWCGEIKTIC